MALVANPFVASSLRLSLSESDRSDKDGQPRPPTLTAYSVRRAGADEVVIILDTRERYAYRFNGQSVTAGSRGQSSETPV